MKRWRALPGPLRAALIVWTLFAVSHLLGLREHVSVVSGTPVPGVPFEIAIVTGGLYVLLWLAAVVVAPILAIASGVSWLLLRYWPVSASPEGASAGSPSTPSR